MTAMLIAAPEYRSPEWHAWRRHGLGASDLAAVVGVDTFTSEYQLWADKRAEVVPEDRPSDVMRLGSHIEAYALARWQETNRLELVTGETFGDPRWPNLWATLDGRAGRIGVEAKYTTRSEELPEKWVVQALAQIGLADLDCVDIVRVNPRGEVTPHRVERDDARITRLLDLGQGWFERYVIGGEEPPLDGSPAARKRLDGMVGTEQRDADDQQLGLLADLRRTRKALERLTTAEERLVRDIKASMAGAGVLVAPGARVTWAAVKGRTTTSWEQIANGLRSRCTDEEWEAVVSLATTTSAPGTRFAVKYTEEETE
jgi:putative phage-type endonuclease